MKNKTDSLEKLEQHNQVFKNLDNLVISHFSSSTFAFIGIKIQHGGGQGLFKEAGRCEDSEPLGLTNLPISLIISQCAR